MITNHTIRVQELINTVNSATALATKEEYELRNEDRIEEAEAFKLKTELLRSIASSLIKYQKRQSEEAAGD